MFANCNFSSANFLKKLTDPSQLESISIKINNRRKWGKNSIKILANVSNYIKKKI